MIETGSEATLWTRQTLCVSFSTALLLPVSDTSHYISMASRETMDTNCMTLTRFILAEQKKYAPGGTGEPRPGIVVILCNGWGKL